MYLGGRETTTNRTGVDYAECVPGGRETTTNRTGVDYAECVPGGRDPTTPPLRE